MVSHPERRRNLTRRVSAFAVVALGAACGCSRQHELYDDTDGGVNVVRTPKPPDTIPQVPDSGLDAPELPACSERPTGECLGANDFPCEFQGWVELAAARCQESVACPARGWLGVSLGAEGCVTAIEMTDPDPLFVACLAEVFGTAACPQCSAMHATRFLGTNPSCAHVCEVDADCPDGELCVSGSCEAELH